MMQSKKNSLSKISTSTSHVCTSCGTEGMSVFYQLDNVSVHSVLNMPTREKALSYPKGDISLGFCQRCGFISNIMFNPTVLEYSSNCEESQWCSPTFNAFARQLAVDLIERHDLHQKDILEIGCGKGNFLTLLCDLGKNRGVGFDPAYVTGRNTSNSSNHITFITDFYNEKYADYQADFLCCQMTLEHVQDPYNFVSMVRHSIGERTNTIVFFQVPDVTRILSDCAFEDIYYEHCSYFSPVSLVHLFVKCNFDVLNVQTAYDNQYLLIEAKPTNGQQTDSFSSQYDLDKFTDLVVGFKNTYDSKIATWKDRLHEFSSQKKRVVLWGSGSKGVSFLTNLKIHDHIEYVVDINPHRQRTYMAGTGQKIVAPDFLKTYNPDAVIVMNSIYCDEIKHDLNKMHLTPELLTL